MGRVRESMFSTLISMGVFNAPRKVAVLDTFCGGGSVGIEAISRGAAFAGFVDLSREACDVALRNAKACGFETRAGAACVTAESAIEGKAFDGRKFDVVSITPPYDEVSYKALCDLLASSPIMNEDCVAVIEYPIELGSLPARLGSTGQLVGLRNRRYGRTVLAFYAYRPTGKLNLDPRPEEFEVSRWK
ncbi:RNA methyltransferase [Pelagophyceae sp. CCMP2097]|nr:RNA methyltransferase [Pelagophyceae sp. CCMP2097]